MPSGYLDYPIVTDPDAISAIALDFLTANLPGWVPVEGNLEVWIIEACARMVAEARDVASRVPKAIFRYFGQTLMGIAPIDGAKATALTTWTAVDGQGYTIRAGTVVGYQALGDTVVPFEVVADVVIPSGYSSTAPGAVQIRAVDTGSSENGIAIATHFVMVDALAWVVSVVSTTVTAGGADAESDDAYLDRLAQELTLMSPRLILPGDFAIYARRTPGVYRATAIDGYDPGTATFGNERTVTVSAVDASGNGVPSGTKTAMLANLEAQREVNFLIYAIDPTTTAIAVAFTAVAEADFDPTIVQTDAIATVTNYLQPYNWGGGNLMPPQWDAETKVRYLEVATLLNNVLGLRYVSALTIMGSAADYTLPGVAALTSPGVITGTVT